MEVEPKIFPLKWRAKRGREKKKSRKEKKQKTVMIIRRLGRRTPRRQSVICIKWEEESYPSYLKRNLIAFLVELGNGEK